MPLYQRFDLDATEPITPPEIKRRWNEFHRQIRAMSGTPLQRIAGRMLGEDTWRYHTARFIFRPMLQLWRKRRKREAKTPTRVAATREATIYPVNYRPRTVNYAQELAGLVFDEKDVAVVTIDDTTAIDETLRTLNETLNETEATWLFLTDVSMSAGQTRFSIGSLIARATKEHDVVFGDETGVNPFAPILKSPAVGPHTLLSYNVIGRPALLRVETLFRLGGFSPDAGVAFEHDAYLRLSEASATFHHVQTVLPAGRPAVDFDLERMAPNTQRVVESAIARRGWKGTVTPGSLAGVMRWKLEAPASNPSIDIVIPTRDRIELVRQCIESIESKSTYTNYNIIILDNDSAKQETLDYFKETKYTVVPCPGPFNYAKIVNRGVQHATADYIVTLNNDTIVVTPDWLEQLLSLASLPDVGIVGASLLDPDGHHEHDGIVIAPYPQHLRTDSNYPYVDPYAIAIKDMAAVTGAVQMVERTFWDSLGGMDEELKVVMNDVDICLRSQMEGRYVVYDPDVQLFHAAGSSRGRLDPLDDRDRFIRRWDIFGSFRDPFFPEAELLLGEKVFFFLR